MSIHIGILCCSIITLPLEAKNYSPHPKKHRSTAVEKKHSRSNRKIIEIHLSHCWTNSIRRLLYKYILRLLCSINTITLRMSVKFSFLGAKFLMETHFCDIFSTKARFVCSCHSGVFFALMFDGYWRSFQYDMAKKWKRSDNIAIWWTKYH